MTLPRTSAVLLIAFCWLGLGGPRAAAETREQAIGCLALAMYWEAKAEGAEGMRAVAAVVLNRVAHPEFPRTVCGVVKQGGERPPCQFSWWCDGKSDQPTETAGLEAGPASRPGPPERAAPTGGAGSDPGRAVLPQRPDLDPLGDAAPAYGPDRPPYLLSLRGEPGAGWPPGSGAE